MDSTHIVLGIDVLGVSSTVYGFTLDLAEAVPQGPPLLKARVKISPQTARALHLILGKHLREYERQFGKVVLPVHELHAWGLEEEL